MLTVKQFKRIPWSNKFGKCTILISLLIFTILYYHIKCSENSCCKDTYLTQDWHQRTISIMVHPFTSHEILVANTALKDYGRIPQMVSCCFLNAVHPDWRTSNDAERRYTGGQQVCTGFHFFLLRSNSMLGIWYYSLPTELIIKIQTGFYFLCNKYNLSPTLCSVLGQALST